MTILWAGGEDTSFPVATPGLDTSGARYRTSYARCALNTYYSGGGFPGFGRSVLFPGGEITDGWLGCQGWGGSTYQARLIGLGSSADYVTGKGIWICGNANKFGLYKFDTEMRLLDEEVVGTMTGAIRKYDLELIDYGAAGTVRFYINGEVAPILEYTGDISIAGITGFDCVLINRLNNETHCFSEIIVADEDTRALSLTTLPPAGAGAENQWDGAYTDIDEVSLSDADVIYTNTGGEDFKAALGNLPAGSFAIKGVIIEARVCKSADATADQVCLGVDTDGNENVGSALTLDTAWNTYIRLLATNPVTSEEWSQAQIDSLELLLRSATSVPSASVSASPSATKSSSISASASAS